MFFFFFFNSKILDNLGEAMLNIVGEEEERRGVGWSGRVIKLAVGK